MQLPVPWNTVNASHRADLTANGVGAKSTEPSVIDFDKINSRFMMFSQQNTYGFAGADFVNLS